MTPVPIWNPTDRLLWGIGITLLILCGSFYVYRGLKREDRNERLILIGFAMFIYAFTFHRICFFIADFQQPGVFENLVFLILRHLNHQSFQGTG